AGRAPGQPSHNRLVPFVWMRLLRRRERSDLMQPPKQRPPGAPPPQDHPDHPDQMGQPAPEPPPADVRPGSTSAQLKHDINSGLTGDKVNYFDPAAAPLGTDEEAGGSPPTPEEVHQARMAERS